MQRIREQYDNVIGDVLKHFNNKRHEGQAYEENTALSAGKLLMLICGGKSGSDVIPEQIRCLQKEGYAIKILFSETGNQMFGSSWLQENDLIIPVVNDDEGYFELLMDADMVVIPVLTMNTAAKIAYGIADNRITTLVMQALLQNKPIIAAENACNPIFLSDFNQRKNHVYHNMLAKNVSILEQFGITLTKSSQLCFTVKKNMPYKTQTAKMSLAAADYHKNSEQESVLDEDEIFKDQVFSANDILRYRSNVIRIAANVLITPAAREAAKENGIELVKMNTIS